MKRITLQTSTSSMSRPGLLFDTSGRRWILAALIALSCEAQAAPLTGRPIADVLEELRSHGVTFIYNADIVPDHLRIVDEPKSRNATELAAELLAPHGLQLRLIAPRIYAIVPSPTAPNPLTKAGPINDRAPAPLVEEVVVQTSRYAVAQDIGASHAFLDQIQVTNLPRLGDETLQAVQRLPGAAVNGFSGIGPIRGGVANETAIVLDGLRLYEPFHLKNYLSPVSLLDSRLIDGIDVYFGGFPVVYGDRMSAIIDAKTIRPAIKQYYELGLTVFHAGAMGSTRFNEDAGDVLVSARRSNLGELSDLAEKDVGKPRYADGFARVAYRFSDATKASVSALLSSDQVNAIRSAGAETAQDESSNSYVWLTLEHDWSSALQSRAILSWTDVHDERDGQVNDPGRRNGVVEDDRAFGVIGLRFDNEWRSDLFTHRFGAELRRLWAEYEYRADVRFEEGFPFPGSPATQVSRVELLHPDGFEASGYWDLRFNPADPWTIEGGLRVDTQTYDGSGDAEQWGPRLSILYQMQANTRLRASWGRFYQSQGINELQVEDGVTRFHPAQHAEHMIASIEHTFASRLDMRVELYRKEYGRLAPRFENLLDPTVLLPELAFDRVRIDADSARAEGAELSFNWHSDGAWAGWFSYSWSRVDDRISGNDVPRSWDQRHALSLGLAWTHGPWALTAANSFHTGWPTTQLTLAEPPSQPIVVVGPRNASRYDSFNSLDIRLTRTFALPNGHLDAFVEVTNAFSRENPCCTRYQLSVEPDGSAVLTHDTDNWLPLVPSFGVLWRYGKP